MGATAASYPDGAAGGAAILTVRCDPVWVQVLFTRSRFYVLRMNSLLPVHTHAHMHVRVCVLVYIRISLKKNIYTYTHIRIRKCVRACVYVFVCVR